MKICIIGKFPPIEGGVSARTYWLAHDLAKLGHQIYVVTNGNEVKKPYRMKMTKSDWRFCEKNYDSGGFVRVYWTNDRLDDQYHIPWHNPFVTKLTSRAIVVDRENNIDLFFSYYLEPYAIAGYLVSQITQKPHIIKHAGSDIGKLYDQLDFKELYLHILKQSNVIITGNVVSEKLIKEGVDLYKIAIGFPTKLSLAFSPTGNKMRLKVRPDTKIIGIYGKIDERKGTFNLVKAIKVLINKNPNVHLVIVGSGEDKEQKFLNKLICKLSLEKYITQLPYMPNWKIPKFIRSCHAVCFLEQDFPINFHTPTVALEVLACGIPLICSVEVLKKQPLRHLLIHGNNCIAIHNVKSVNELADKIQLILLSTRQELKYIGNNGYQYYKSISALIPYPENYHRLFIKTLSHQIIDNHLVKHKNNENDLLLWTNKILSLYENRSDSNPNKLVDQPIKVISELLKKLPNCEKSANKLKLYKELVLFEQRIILWMNNNGNVQSDFLNSLLRGFNDIKIIEEINITDVKFKLNVNYKSYLYHYNFNKLLQMRNKTLLPIELNRSRNYMVIFNAPSSDIVELILLTKTEFNLIQKMSHSLYVSGEERHKKFLIDMVRIGFLSIFNKRNL